VDDQDGGPGQDPAEEGSWWRLQVHQKWRRRDCGRIRSLGSDRSPAAVTSAQYVSRPARLRAEQTTRPNRGVRPVCRWIPLTPGTLGFFGQPALRCDAASTEKAGWTLATGGAAWRGQPTVSRHRQHKSASFLREKLDSPRAAIPTIQTQPSQSESLLDESRCRCRIADFP